MANPTAKREHVQVAKDTANYLDLMPVTKSSLNINIIRMMPILSHPIPGERTAITTPSILRLGPKALGLNMFAKLKENQEHLAILRSMPITQIKHWCKQ